MPSLDNPGATVTSDQVAQIQATLGITPPTFNYYLKHFSQVPEKQTFSGSGSVIAFTLKNTTRYLFIPDPYDPTQEAFYANFSDPVLSNLIIKRSLS